MTGMKADKTTIRVTCSECGAENNFNLGDIADAAGAKSSGGQVTYAITDPCVGLDCDFRLDLEVDLELE
jgi:hypothetical protein